MNMLLWFWTIFLRVHRHVFIYVVLRFDGLLLCHNFRLVTLIFLTVPEKAGKVTLYLNAVCCVDLHVHAYSIAFVSCGIETGNIQSVIV